MNSWRAIIRPLLGLAVGLALGLCFVKISGESPWTVLRLILESSFGSRYDLGVTLYYTTPLIFTGLSVAVAFQAGLFNIGAEGQLTLGALATAAAPALLPNLPSWLALPFAFSCGLLVGGFWGWLPGWLRVRRGGHEVINTIMLNFIAAAIASWCVSGWLRNPEVQSPETRPLPANYFLRAHDPVAAWFGGEAPVSFAFLLAVLAAILVWVFLYRTPWGFMIRATGKNERAAAAAGIDVARMRQLAMALAGMLAAGVALGEVLGFAGRFRLGFSPDYGFIGIAVALLARSHPLAILFSALLFGALHRGAATLDVETEYVTRDLSLVIQALVILAVAVAVSWRKSERVKG